MTQNLGCSRDNTNLCWKPRFPPQDHHVLHFFSYLYCCLFSFRTERYIVQKLLCNSCLSFEDSCLMGYSHGQVRQREISALLPISSSLLYLASKNNYTQNLGYLPCGTLGTHTFPIPEEIAADFKGFLCLLEERFIAPLDKNTHNSGKSWVPVSKTSLGKM